MGSNNAETHRELSESVVVVIIKAQTRNSNNAEAAKANLLIGTQDTDRTQGDLHGINTGPLTRKSSQSATEGREHGGLIHEGKADNWTQVRLIGERE